MLNAPLYTLSNILFHQILNLFLNFFFDEKVGGATIQWNIEGEQLHNYTVEALSNTLQLVL